MKYLLTIALTLASSAAFGQSPAPAAPAAAATGLEAPKPRISSRGEAIANTEFEHRMKVAGLVRELEDVTLQGKIEKERATIRETKKGAEPTIAALVPNASGARDSTAMTFPGVVPPGAATSSSAAPLPPVMPANPETPILQGIIGDRAVFKNGRSSTVVAIGGTFEGYRVEGIAGKEVKVRGVNRPDIEAVLSLP